MKNPLNPKLIRTKFPELDRDTVFLDNAGGTCMTNFARLRLIEQLYEVQKPLKVGSHPATSETIEENRAGIADLIHARSANEIIFGPNTTSLIFHISRSLGRLLKPGDHVAVTHLDHDANISPWLMLAEDRQCQVDWVDIEPEGCGLDLDSLARVLTKSPRLVAVTYASNVSGTITPLEKIMGMCHAAGALVFVDAVQYVPHAPIDVQALNCDFMVFSLHKLFGPHMGVLYGRAELLEKMTAYQVQSGIHTAPHKFEMGSQKGESIYGLAGVIEYLEWLGKEFGSENPGAPVDNFSGRALMLKRALDSIREYELKLVQLLQNGLAEIPGVHPVGFGKRVDPVLRLPIFAFWVTGFTPAEVERRMLENGIKIWSGHFHASEVTQFLHAPQGLVRVSAVHYNSAEDIERFLSLSHSPSPLPQQN